MPNAKSYLDEYQEHLCYAFKLTTAECFAIQNLARSKNGEAVGLYVLSRGLPIEVAIHTMSALSALGIDVAGFEHQVLRGTFSEPDENTLLCLRLAELAGKVAAKEESHLRSVHGCISFIMESEDLSWMGMTIPDRGTGSQRLRDLAMQITAWTRWECFHNYVDKVEKRIVELLESLSLPEATTGKELVVLEADRPGDASGRVFDDFHCSTTLAAAMRRAEGITALLEEHENAALGASWLFRKELQEENRRLDDWVAFPEMIGRVKKSLAARLEQLVPASEFSKEEWSSWMNEVSEQ